LTKSKSIEIKLKH